MDRLEQKGIVARRKVGRAFRYQAKLSAEEARLKAVEKIVEGFFDGSPEALAAHLSSQGRHGPANFVSRASPPLTRPPPLLQNCTREVSTRVTLKKMFPAPYSIRDKVISPGTVLAPMAGVTDTVFRRMIRSLGGCGLIMTEFTSAECITRNNARTSRYLFFEEDEHPDHRPVVWR